MQLMYAAPKGKNRYQPSFGKKAPLAQEVQICPGVAYLKKMTSEWQPWFCQSALGLLWLQFSLPPPVH